MLTLWRRHKSSCPHKEDRYYRKCRCSVHVEGTIESIYRRHSLKTRSWERAVEICRDIEDGKKDEKPPITLEDAAILFLADCEARNLQPTTLRKHKLLKKALVAFAPKYLKDVDATCLMKFRASWTEASLTQAKKLERLRSMFRWFAIIDLIPKSPAAGMKASITHDAAVAPFSRAEQAKILEAAYRLSRTQEHQPKQLPVNPKTGTFANLLLNSALRITDAAMLDKERVQGERLFLYAAKNKKPVTLLLPPDLLHELQAIESNPLFPSPEGSTKPATVSDYWRDQLIKVFQHCGIKGHPHRFRHSMAVNMLDGGSSIEDVALVLGDSPTIVAEHYSHFCQSRQERIDREIQKTWAKPRLQRVK